MCFLLQKGVAVTDLGVAGVDLVALQLLSHSDLGAADVIEAGAWGHQIDIHR